MKKKNILKKNYDFQKIIKLKKIIISKFLVVYYLENNLNEARIGISISKKFLNAVKRNKIRRQVRSVLDLNNFFYIKKDIVLIIRKPFINSDFNTKKNEIFKMLKKVHGVV